MRGSRRRQKPAVGRQLLSAIRRKQAALHARHEDRADVMRLLAVHPEAVVIADRDEAIRIVRNRGARGIPLLAVST